MTKKQTTIRFEHEVYELLENISSRRKIPLNDVVNEACKIFVQIDNQKMMDHLFAPVIEKYMQQHLKSFENRLASLMAKNALDSSMTMFMLLDSISKSRKQDPEELYQTMRKMAVKHVQKRDELLDIVKDNINSKG